MPCTFVLYQGHWANGPANAATTPSPVRAPSVRNTAGGCRPTAIRAAWRQPAGKGHCKRLGSALASACTFGAKHSRGLPPNRYQSRMAAACGQRALQTPRQCSRQCVHLWCETQPGASAQPLSEPHGGSLRAKGIANAATTPSPARAPLVRNIAGGCRPTADKLRRTSTPLGFRQTSCVVIFGRDDAGCSFRRSETRLWAGFVAFRYLTARLRTLNVTCDAAEGAGVDRKWRADRADGREWNGWGPAATVGPIRPATTSTFYSLPSTLYFWPVAKNRGDRTPLELFVAGLAGWDNGLKRQLGQADQS